MENWRGAGLRMEAVGGRWRGAIREGMAGHFADPFPNSIVFFVDFLLNTWFSTVHGIWKAKPNDLGT